MGCLRHGPPEAWASSKGRSEARGRAEGLELQMLILWTLSTRPDRRQCCRPSRRRGPMASACVGQPAFAAPMASSSASTSEQGHRHNQRYGATGERLVAG
jgi:hypothetical protein